MKVTGEISKNFPLVKNTRYNIMVSTLGPFSFKLSRVCFGYLLVKSLIWYIIYLVKDSPQQPSILYEFMTHSMSYMYLTQKRDTQNSHDSLRVSIFVGLKGWEIPIVATWRQFVGDNCMFEKGMGLGGGGVRH